MRLCTDDNEISPFTSHTGLLGNIDQIPFNLDEEDTLIKTTSIEVVPEVEEEETPVQAGNLLKERKHQANNQQIFGASSDSDEEPELEIEQILELDVPIINYGQFISTKVLGSTIQLTNKTKEE